MLIKSTNEQGKRNLFADDNRNMIPIRFDFVFEIYYYCTLFYQMILCFCKFY